MDDAALNAKRHAVVGNPEFEARITQYETAFRMQFSMPELTDVSGEPESVLGLCGPDVRHPGTYVVNRLLARRLAERGVGFIQLFHQGWDHHGGLPKALRGLCHGTDQASAGAILHLLGVNHEKLAHEYQGRQYRLTDVAGRLIRKALA